MTAACRTMIFSLIAAFSLVFAASAQEVGERRSLKLYGARSTVLAAAPNGQIVFAGFEGPYGIFYSTDFGATWQLAFGGDYTSGTGRSIVVGPSSAFAIAGNEIYETELAAPTAWERVAQPSGPPVINNPRTLALQGAHLIVGDGAGTVAVFDTETGALLSQRATGATGQIRRIAVAPAGGYIFVEQEGDSFRGKYFRGSYDPIGGSIGAFSEITANVGVLSGKLNGLAVDPSERLYISTFNAAGGQDGVYRSADWGDNFARIVSPSNAAGNSFVGTTYVVGSYVSLDAGNTWNEIQSSGQSRVSPNLFLINPADNEQAIAGSDLGLVRTANLTSAGHASTWVTANEGLEGTTVQDMAQGTDKNRVFVATDTAFGFSDNFLSTEPTWQFPVGGLDGSGASAVAIDPANDDKLYASTNVIYQGTVDDSATPATINWVVLEPAPMGFLRITDLDMVPGIPGVLMASSAQSEDSIDGHLRFYDTANGNARTTVAALEGLPVRDVLAVNSNLMFVTVSAPGAPSTATHGVYKCSANCLTAGASWIQMEDPDMPANAAASRLAYDALNDVLYSGSGQGLFVLEGASTNTDWRRADGDFGAVWTVAVDPSTGIVYISGYNRIYASADFGVSWRVLFEGLNDERTSCLFFDDLVQGANTGFWQLDTTGTFLTSPVYALWNGYLEMNNILELVNKSGNVLNVTITLFDITGAQVAGNSTTVPVPANGQWDVLLNQLPGFQPNSYGIARLTYEGASLEGRLSFYRNASAQGQYEFAFAVPFTNTLSGRSSVGFNTFQPSQKASEAGDRVAQWLSIVNLDPAAVKQFRVKSYNQLGAVIGDADGTPYSIGPFQRVDIEAGHVNPGPGKVGLHEIIPPDGTTPYLAHLVRYGERPATGGYAFAFPLLAKSGTNAEQWVPISNGSGGENWLELLNPSDSGAVVTVQFYDIYGRSLTDPPLVRHLGAHAQDHIMASGYLDAGVSGGAKISSSSSVLAQSMFYFRDGAGSIEAMYGSQSAPVAQGGKFGSYNLFLDMENWLRIFNTTDASADVDITVRHPAGTLNRRSISLAARSGIDLGLHETANYGTTRSTYGQLEVTGNVLVELLRLKRVAPGSAPLDFAAPTAVR